MNSPITQKTFREDRTAAKKDNVARATRRRRRILRGRIHRCAIGDFGMYGEGFCRDGTVCGRFADLSGKAEQDI